MTRTKSWLCNYLVIIFNESCIFYYLYLKKQCIVIYNNIMNNVQKLSRNLPKKKIIYTKTVII